MLVMQKEIIGWHTTSVAEKAASAIHLLGLSAFQA